MKCNDWFVSINGNKATGPFVSQAEAKKYAIDAADYGDYVEIWYATEYQKYTCSATLRKVVDE